MFVGVGDCALIFDEPVHGCTGTVELKQQLMRFALQEFESALWHHQEPQSAATLRNVHVLVPMISVLFEEFSFADSYTEISIEVVSRHECFG